jgi:aspartate/methionine/tyrosine aminotransferase
MEPNPFGDQGMTDVINLSSGDPGFSTPDHIVKAALSALQEGETHYTMTNGIFELRREISKYYNKFGVNADPESEVIVSPGSQQALYLLLASVLDTQDEVLIANPSYTVYSPLIKYLKAKPIFFSLKVSSKTKAILICSPNNPTGTVLNISDLEAVAHIAEEYNLLVISDEIYNEFIWNGKHKSIAAFPNMKERSIIISSFSKTFAMTGWRLGYLIAPKLLTTMMLGLQGNMVLCPASFVQKAGVAALNGPWGPVQEMAKEYEKRVKIVSKRLNEMNGVSCAMPEGAFYAWVDISEHNSSSLSFCYDLLEKQKVVTVAGIHFGSAGEGYIRLALVSPIDTLSKAMDRIETYVKSL